MDMDILNSLKYIPIFRARQQEMIVLKENTFGDRIFPMVEIIKEKDRTNRTATSIEIYTELIQSINAPKVLVDLPTYIKETTSTQKEVIQFNRSILENLDARITFFKSLGALHERTVPVISTLIHKTGETNTIRKQYEALKTIFPVVAIRTFHYTFENDLENISSCLQPDDLLIYDLDTLSTTSPLLKIHKTKIAVIKTHKALIRSAINTEIQNVKLDHGNIVGEADNSLIETYANYGFQAFGDYVGIKKDDMTSGGTISPGFIFYDPIDNLFYGYKGDVKKLSEFETTIVPAVLNSDTIKRMRTEFPEYLDRAQNLGYDLLLKINENPTAESGKSQAKFKKISMEHYFHCIKTSLNNGKIV